MPITVSSVIILWLFHFFAIVVANHYTFSQDNGQLYRTTIAPNANKTSTQSEKWPRLSVSMSAYRTQNKMRNALNFLKTPYNKNYTPIYMNLGDPSIGGNLPPHDSVIDALHTAVDNRAFDGYGPSFGIESARAAIVSHFSTPKANFTADDVILTSGATHALQIAIEAIANPGDNILVPIPGFPAYITQAKSYDIEVREYRLMLDKGGYINLHHLESLINGRTKAIIINNPSNPTGTVFSKKVLENVVKIAFRHKIIIIADEIYGELVYNGAKFYPLAELRPKVPIIVCDAISKRYLVPGWRLGWLIIHNRYGALDEIKKGMISLTQRMLGPSMIVQGALPDILDNTPHRAIEHVQRTVGTNADIMYDCLRQVNGLRPMRPSGSMYMVVKYDSKIYGDDKQFIAGLIKEKSIYVIPGDVFHLPGWFRIVLTYSCSTTRDACGRIVDYCNGILAEQKRME